MMAEFSWTQMFSSAILMLQLTAAAEYYELIVRDGGEVTLLCENDPDKCDRTTWIFSNAATVTLFEHGEIHKDAHTRSDRLSVTAECSLVIKKVTTEDVGRYTCRRYNKSGQQDGPGTEADLCVVNMTEQKGDNTVKLNCSVSTNRECKYTVTWIYDENKELMISQSACSASVTFTTSDYIYTSEEDDLLTCRVTSFDNNVQEFTFTIQSPGQKIAWWMFVVVALALAALVIAVVVAIRWKRAKGNKIQKNENTELNLNPAVTPGTIQDPADPEDAVAYASISYTKNTSSKAQVPGKDDDEEDEAVTYSIVKLLTSSSFGPCTDP